MNAIMVRIALLGLLAISSGHAEKFIRGTVRGLDGHLLDVGEVRVFWDCANCGIMGPIDIGIGGRFEFPNIDDSFYGGALVKIQYSGGTYAMGRYLTVPGPTDLSLQLTDQIDVNGDFVISELGADTKASNRKTSFAFPSGNLIYNGSLEAENYLFAGSAIHGWVGYWGATIARTNVQTAQFGNWFLRATTTADNQAGQFQGAEYVISEEDPAFQAIEKANSDGKSVTISAWVRASTSAMGKSIVFDDLFFQGNDAAFTFSDNAWHKISYTFTGIQPHPNTFAFREMGFVVHEKNPSADVFSFDIDNVLLSVGNANEQSPIVTSVDLSDGLAKVVQSEVMREKSNTDEITRVVQMQDYDLIGRPGRKWLPFEEVCAGAACMNVSSSTANSHYQGGANGLPNAGGYAYSSPIYENEPLTRVLQSSSPGTYYTAGSGHNRKSSFSATHDLLESSLGSDPANPINTSNPVYSYEYVRDPNGHGSMIWKDQLGNPVKATGIDPSGDGFVSTRTVYDDRGLPSVMLPPISCKDAQGNTTLTPNCVNPRELTYDQEKHLIKEVSPDAGTTRSVYNVAGQLRATQTQAQAAKGEFTILKYSIRGELLETGLMTGNLDDFNAVDYVDDVLVGNQLVEAPGKLEFASAKNAFDYAKQKVALTSRSAPLTFYFVSYSPEEIYTAPSGTEFTSVKDKDGKDIEVDFDNTIYDSEQYRALVNGREQGSHGSPIEDPNWPYAGSYQVAMKYVYEDVGNLPSDLFVDGHPFIIPIGETTGFAKGKQIASINYNPHLAVLWPNLADRVVSSFSKYDAEGNVVAEFKYIGAISNSAKKIQEIDYTYDQSKRLITKTVWKTASGTTCADMTSFQRYAYDAQNRLAKVYTNGPTNCNLEVQIAAYDYFPDGKVKHLNLGNPVDNISVDYTYHLHGMMNTIVAKRATCIV